MADLEEKFQAAADEVEAMRAYLSEDDQLKLYALYKQGMPANMAGDEVVGRGPSAADFEDLDRYEEWAAERAEDDQQAMQQYVEMVDELRRDRE